MPFNVGPLELVIVLVIALLVIGPKRLPEMGNSLGKTIREFRKASSDVTEAVSLEPDSKPAAQQAAAGSSTAPAAAGASTENAPAAPVADEVEPAAGDPPPGAGSEAADQPAKSKSDD
jgi:TatA/E family protein of Tat protein translocase